MLQRMANPNETRAGAERGAHAIHPGTRIGHAHLKVSDLDRALRFWHDVLGFEVTQRLGHGAAFLSAGGYHHHIGLNTWESAGGSAPARGTTGLYHVAILYPDRKALAIALKRVLEAGIQLRSRRQRGRALPRPPRGGVAA